MEIHLAIKIGHGIIMLVVFISQCRLIDAKVGHVGEGLGRRVVVEDYGKARHMSSAILF
jgi:hypothetical protein